MCCDQSDTGIIKAKNVDGLLGLLLLDVYAEQGCSIICKLTSNMRGWGHVVGSPSAARHLKG